MFKLEIAVKTVFDEVLVMDMVRNIAKGFVFGDMLKKILAVIISYRFLVALMQLFFCVVLVLSS